MNHRTVTIVIITKARTNAGIANSDSEVKELATLAANDKVDSEVVLLTDEEQDEDVTSEEPVLSRDEESIGRRKSVIKLLLIRAPWYIIGLLILVIAIVLSQYDIHLPYQHTTTSCTDVLNDTIDNELNFTNFTNTLAACDSTIIRIP